MRLLRMIVLLLTMLHCVLAQAKTPMVFSGIEGSVNSDISMQVLEKAYTRLGIAIKYLPLPGERALRTSNSGQIDGEVFRIANVSKRYKNLIQIPTPINTLPGIAFSIDKDFRVQGWQSLKPYQLGIQNGIKFAERGTQGMNPVVVDTNKQLFRMLNSGRIDVAIAAQTNGLKTLADLKLVDVKMLQPAIDIYPLYHYLHKKHANLVPLIDVVLQGMRNSGEIRAIREERLEQFRQTIKKSNK